MERWAKSLLVVATLVRLGVAVQQRYRVALKRQDPPGGHVNDLDRWMMMVLHFIHDRVDYVDDLADPSGQPARARAASRHHVSAEEPAV